MHKNYADDILKHQSRTSEVERYYMNKLQEITEQNRYEILGLQNKVQRFEQVNEKLTEENNDLRKELRLARVKDQDKENQEIREKRYMSNEKIQADLEDLGQKEFQDRMQKTQQEFQTQKLKFLEELQNQNY
ncbi:hypothetical protein PPERSA_03203 [Pseudocohnilembus persalinus]|uniref:Uncharacterized protein n=1 Tax=Pseudocohnilembus persalinus TaxID=266149 RepID=A0A0V0QE82_PSEPJ|nr:hypothetical protein PPERSA_03203 [Pseudocohnilembus persalinus]|eukprot:KRX00470.1 hypothetical protein PPERSA_03203 [Pseudocohnilembus persalinus]